MFNLGVMLLGIQALALASPLLAQPFAQRNHVKENFEWVGDTIVDDKLIPFAFEAETTEQLLTQIISEPENNRHHQMFVTVDASQSAVGLVRRSPDREQVYTLEQVISGVVLAKAQNRNALYLTCKNCTATGGGKVTLKYLFNGLTNYYKEFDMTLKNDEGQWALYSNNLVRIHKLRLIARKIAGQLVGIRSIVVED